MKKRFQRVVLRKNEEKVSPLDLSHESYNEEASHHIVTRLWSRISISILQVAPNAKRYLMPEQREGDVGRLLKYYGKVTTEIKLQTTSFAYSNYSYLTSEKILLYAI